MDSDKPQRFVLTVNPKTKVASASEPQCTVKTSLRVGALEIFSDSLDSIPLGREEPVTALGNGLQQIASMSFGADGGAGEDIWSFPTGQRAEVLDTYGAEGIPTVDPIGANRFAISGWWWPPSKSHADSIQTEIIAEYHPGVTDPHHAWTLVRGSQVVFAAFINLPKSEASGAGHVAATMKAFGRVEAAACPDGSLIQTAAALNAFGDAPDMQYATATPEQARKLLEYFNMQQLPPPWDSLVVAWEKYGSTVMLVPGTDGCTAADTVEFTRQVPMAELQAAMAQLGLTGIGGGDGGAEGETAPP